MHPKEIEIFVKRIEQRTRQSLMAFRGRTIDDELIEKMGRQLASDIGPIVAEFIGPIIRNLRAVNVGKDKVEITGELVLGTLNRLRDFSRSGNVQPIIDRVDQLRQKK